eukprot:COSAG01_NODE_52729_length_344_cov_1.722449_1_plen_24_part_01
MSRALRQTMHFAVWDFLGPRDPYS